MRIASFLGPPNVRNFSLNSCFECDSLSLTSSKAGVTFCEGKDEATNGGPVKSRV
jgi:hypothetical protein